MRRIRPLTRFGMASAAPNGARARPGRRRARLFPSRRPPSHARSLLGSLGRREFAAMNARGTADEEECAAVESLADGTRSHGSAVKEAVTSQDLKAPNGKKFPAASAFDSDFAWSIRAETGGKDLPPPQFTAPDEGHARRKRRPRRRPHRRGSGELRIPARVRTIAKKIPLCSPSSSSSSWAKCVGRRALECQAAALNNVSAKMRPGFERDLPPAIHLSPGLRR